MWDPEGGGGGDPGEEPLPPYHEEELKDQFQQQRDKIEELREFLKKNEEQLMSRGKAVEKYGTKLSDIKSRSKASKRKSTTPVQDSSEARTPDHGVETPKEEMSTPRRSSAKKAQGNLVLLRKQLEENRVKFELRGKELSENKKGVEEMVQHLKNQLDERDVQIKELQKHVETQQPLDADASIEGDVTQQDVFTQIIHKDNKIIELNRKISDLETKLLDLQESFSEKDSVIAARTKAIALMSEDFSRRSKTTVDNLEETREEMRKMQSNFVLEETKMKKEIEELKKELAAKNQRLHQVEDTNKDLLSLRFDLSARNAGLQEKVVKMHEKNLELQKEINVLEETVNARTEAKKDASLQRQLDEANTLKETLQSQLDEANKQMSKIKAQHKSKVRSLAKQLDGLKKMSDANEEIVMLQNKIAELEEDKGNLQLHLVDFDELKVSESHWQTRVSELEERISQQNQDLDTHVHMIALLEAEKLDHIKDIQLEREKVISLGEENEKLKAASLELENQRLSLEMRTVDLEEQIDIINKEKKELQEELEAKSSLSITEEKQVYEEKQSLLDVSNSSQVTEEEQRHVELDERMNKLDLEAELENLRKVIEEQKNIIMDLNFKIDSRDEELDLQRDMITKLEELSGKEKEDKIMDIVKELNEMASDLEEWKERCTEVEKRLQDLGIEKDEIEERFNEVKIENSTLKQQLVDQRELAADLTTKLRDQSNGITHRDEKINVLQSMIELNGQTLEAREMTLKDVHEKLNTVEKQFENRLSELKSVLHDKEKEILEMATSLRKQDGILIDREREINELSSELNRERKEFESLQQHVSYVENSALQLEAQLTELSRTAAEKDLLSSQLAQDCQHHKEQIEKLNSELSDKIEYINKIELEKSTLRDIESKLKEADEELNKLKIEMEPARAELREKLEKLSEAERKVTELTEKNKKYIANLKAKTLTIKGQEQKLQQYEMVIKEKENMLLTLTATKDTLVEQTEAKNKLDTQEVQNHLERIDVLTKELLEEQSRTELLAEELTRATEKICTLERDLKNSESKSQEIHSLEEKISEIQMELKNKEEEVNSLRKDNFELSEQESELRISLDEYRIKHASLEEKMAVLETELITRKDELDGVKNVISDRESRIDQLTEQMMEISEKGSQSLSANEAKLQEREAVVEFLEYEVSKSKETIQHLEERLAFVEERRLSLENKAEALNLRAQESDRMKEEAVETEGMLEKRFEMLLASEESLKKKVGSLATENEELSQKNAEITTQNVEAKREIQNLECTVKDLVKEVERLTPLEFSFIQSSEKVETLELELKRVTSEFEYRMNEKIHKLQQHSESLESDLRNVNMELEKVESERRTLLERYEKLNDEKLNLEDEIERQNEAITSYKLANEDLKEKYNTDKVKTQLEERIQLLEVELGSKASVLEEKEILIEEQNEKLQILEKERKEGITTVESLLSSKEELNERLKQLQISFEAVTVEKDKLQAEMQSKSTETAIDVSSSEYEECITRLNAELDSLKSVISQKDNELKNYQTHMLQLQFGSVHPTAIPGQVSQLEQKKSELEEMIKAREAQISDMSSVLNLSNAELEELRCQHTEDRCKIETLDKELERLREEIMNRDNYIQQLQMSESATHISDQVDLQRNEFESQLSNLQQQKEELYKELLRMRAQQEVSNIIHVAEYHVQRIPEASMGMNLKGNKPKKKSVSFQVNENKQPIDVDQAEVAVQLENKIKDLEEELQLVRAERDEAMLRLSHLATQSLESNEADNVILMIGSENHTEDVTSITENRIHVLDSQMPRVSTSEAVVTFGTQSWEVNEEEGWWGSDEARLEEEHIQKQQHTLSFSEPTSVLNKRIIELEDHIKDLEAEKERLSEEVHNSQVRSGKMLKKLKELKLKNDSLFKENLELAKVKSKQEFSDLDQAIEEELKIQIDTLEKEVKELASERDSVRAEKESLLKRIDVLTCANDKLVESKERQDIDLELWKQRNKDLSHQIQSLEWRIGELEVTSDSQVDKKEENSFFSWDKQGLNSNSQDFFRNVEQRVSPSGENLDVLMEKEKSLRLAAESHLQDLQQQLIDVNGEIEQLATENASLKNQLEHLHQQQNTNYLQSAYSAVNEEYHRVATENNTLKNQLEQLSQQHSSDFESTYNALKEEYNRLATENVDLKDRLENLNQVTDDLKNAYSTLNEEYNHLATENVNLKNRLENLNQQQVSDELKNAYSTLNEEYHRVVTENVNLKNQLEQLSQRQTGLQNAYDTMSEKCDNLCKETEEFKITSENKYEMMESEYNRKINELTNENIKLDELYQSLQNNQDTLSSELDKLNALNVQYTALQSDFNNLKEHNTVQENALTFANEQKLKLEQELHHLKSFTERDSSNDTAEMLSEQHVKIVQIEKELRIRMEEIEKLRQLNEDHKLEHAKVEQEWNNKMERLRKELELNAESVIQQQNRYTMLEKEHEELKEHVNKVIENQIHEAMNIKQQEIDNLKADLEEKNSYIESQKEMEERMKENASYIENMKHKLAESLDILNIRENDIRNLTTKLSEKEIELNEALSLKDSDIQNLKIQMVDNERRLNEHLGQKDQDIQNLKIQLSEKNLKINELEQSLDEERRRCAELERFLSSRERQSKDESQNIPTLNNDISMSVLEKKISVHSLQDGEDNLSDPQKELDLALYMLHQRDVRCDELTLELMQLLEERDTLQLRLSNALRMNEELRNMARTSTESSPVKIVMSQNIGKDVSGTPGEESPQHTITADTSATASVEVQEDLQSLANKLSELRRVGYHRDVTLQDEREQRHSEQVRLLHQRGSGIVVDANYTLSRDVQSQSTVLLNWIWGRSTPRVMHV